MQMLFCLFSHKKSGTIIHEFSFYAPAILLYISKAATSIFSIQADKIALDLKHEVTAASH
jgi:hypothetical protein